VKSLQLSKAILGSLQARYRQISVNSLGLDQPDGLLSQRFYDFSAIRTFWQGFWVTSAKEN